MSAKKPFWKWLLLLAGGALLFLIVYGVSSIPMAMDESMHIPLWLVLLLNVVTVVLMLALYAGWWKWTEKRPAADLPLQTALRDTGLGFLFGALFFTVLTGIIALLGGYRIGSVRWDWVFLVKNLSLFLVVGVGEEILFRGIFFRMIGDRWGIVPALVISALIFGFMHYMNPGGTVWSSVAIAIEAGLLLAAAYRFSGSLWFPVGIHWAWNFFEGPVFGFAVSGNAAQSVITPVITGSDWITGGAFGAEASIPAVILGLTASVAFMVVQSRDHHVLSWTPEDRGTSDF